VHPLAHWNIWLWLGEAVEDLRPIPLVVTIMEVVVAQAGICLVQLEFQLAPLTP
jgi:hypothetical protein